MIKISRIFIVVLIVLGSPVLSLADSYVGFNLGVAKDLAVKYEYLLEDNAHKAKLIDKIDKKNKELILLNADLEKINSNYENVVGDLKSETLILENKFSDCQDKAFDWEREFTTANQKLVRCLNPPWFKIDLKSFLVGGTTVSLFYLLAL